MIANKILKKCKNCRCNAKIVDEDKNMSNYSEAKEKVSLSGRYARKIDSTSRAAMTRIRARVKELLGTHCGRVIFRKRKAI